MASRSLVFRGINLSDLKMYLEDLGGKQTTDTFPIIYENTNWKAEIVNEKEIAFTRIIKVNEVHIRITADNEDILEEFIKNYRKKTTRVGG